MKVILVRHGESSANALNGASYKMYTGQYDCELTEEGKRMAAALRADPLIPGADAVISSDLKRAVQTARGFWDGEIITDRRLRERSMGEFEGKMVEEVRADPAWQEYFTDPFLSKFHHDFAAKAPGGENYTDVCTRVAEFFAELRKKEYEKVVIVSHFCTIRCMKKILLGLSDEETLSLNIKKCDPTEFEL